MVLLIRAMTQRARKFDDGGEHCWLRTLESLIRSCDVASITADGLQSLPLERSSSTTKAVHLRASKDVV